MILRRAERIHTSHVLITVLLLSFCQLAFSIGNSAYSHDTDTIVMRTPFGWIKFVLLTDVAPVTSSIVKRFAEKGRSGCTRNTCKFYRNEARPGAGQPALGPPYSLLQGVMDLEETPPTENEGHIVVKAGHAAFIPGTKDFFIALNDHSEWGTAHNVFAKVESMTVVDLITSQNYTESTHPEHGTVMRMLNKEVPFVFDVDLESLSVY